MAYQMRITPRSCGLMSIWKSCGWQKVEISFWGIPMKKISESSNLCWKFFGHSLYGKFYRQFIGKDHLSCATIKIADCTKERE